MIIAVLLWHGALTARDYFTRWGPAPETFDAYEGDIAAAAGWLADHPGAEVFLSSDIYRHPSFVFLHEKAPLTKIFEYNDPLVHFFDGRTSLPLPPAGQAATYLFTHNAGPDAAPQRLLGWPGFSSMEEIAGPGGPALTVATFDASQDPAAVLEFAPAQRQISPELRLSGYRLVQTDSTKTIVYLLWEMSAPIAGKPAGFQVQVGLQPPGQGPQITQASAELSYRPSEWQPGSRALSWLELSLPEELPTDLQLAVRVIDQENGAPLPADGATSDGWISSPCLRQIKTLLEGPRVLTQRRKAAENVFCPFSAALRLCVRILDGLRKRCWCGQKLGNGAGIKVRREQHERADADQNACAIERRHIVKRGRMAQAGQEDKASPYEPAPPDQHPHQHQNGQCHHSDRARRTAKQGVAMCPPSSWPAGSRLTPVKRMPK